MWAMRRRLTIIALIGGFFGLFVALPYWYLNRHIPTCYDDMKNQDELGVDCGGTCALVCKGGAKDLSILWQKVFATRKGEYDLVAYIENPNFEIGIKELKYTARLFDKSGAVISERSGQTYVGSNERFAIFSGRMLTGDKVAASGEVVIDPNFKWIRTQKSEVLFSVGNKALTGADKKPRLAADIHNNTTEIARDVDVVSIVYDSKHNPIGVSSTRVEKLIPSGDEKIYFTWNEPFSFEGDTEQCITPVDVVLVLDRSGTMQSESKNPQQPLTTAKEAAQDFVDRLSSRDQGAYISFATKATYPIEQALTDQFSRVKASIGRTAIGTDGIQYTNIGDALKRAMDELGSIRHNDDARKVIVFLTDGDKNDSIDPNSTDPKEYPSQYAYSVVDAVKHSDIALYTIGLGSASRGGFIQEFATTPDYYYPAPTRGDLARVYQDIATNICKKAPSVFEIIPRVDMVTPVGL
jgi:hypothetical protein